MSNRNSLKSFSSFASPMGRELKKTSSLDLASPGGSFAITATVMRSCVKNGKTRVEGTGPVFRSYPISKLGVPGIGRRKSSTPCFDGSFPVAIDDQMIGLKSPYVLSTFFLH